jgi:hypothetical protein
MDFEKEFAEEMEDLREKIDGWISGYCQFIHNGGKLDKKLEKAFCCTEELKHYIDRYFAG